MAKKSRTPEEQFEHELRVFVKAAIRRYSIRWPERTKAKNAARRMRGLYECAMCRNLFKNGEFQLDHIRPVVDLRKPEYTLDEWIRGVLCRADNFQCLCDTCHGIKTGIENKIRTKKKPKKCKVLT